MQIQYFLAEGMRIGLLSLHELLQSPAEACLSLLPDSSHARVLRYRQNADRIRTLFAEVLSRQMLAEALEAAAPLQHPESFASHLQALSPGGLLYAEEPPGKHLHILRDPYGKPYLEGTPVHFSLSHAGPWAACAVAKVPCGVDVETTAVDPEVAEHFFAPGEASADASERLRLWTLKEALCKCRCLPLEESLKTPVSAFPSLRLVVFSLQLPDGAWLSGIMDQPSKR